MSGGAKRRIRVLNFVKHVALRRFQAINQTGGAIDTSLCEHTCSFSLFLLRVRAAGGALSMLSCGDLRWLNELLVVYEIAVYVC